VVVLSDLRALSGYAWSAFRRHRLLAAAAFFGTILATAAAVVLLPRHYTVETEMIADKNAVMSALVSPHRPPADEVPTRLAAEAVMSRQNLLEIVHETGLVARWPSLRSPIGEVREQIARALHQVTSDSARAEMLVGMLRARMSVTTREGTITIGVDWMEPKTAFLLVQAAQRRFLAARSETEVAVIQESIRILEGHVAMAQQAVRDVFAEQPHTVAAASSARRAADASTPRPSAAPANAPQIAALESALAAKRQEIASVVGPRNERLAALRARLAELQNNFGPAHPEIVSLQEGIRSIASDPPQLRTLRADEDGIRAALRTLGVDPDAGTASASRANAAAAQAVLDRLVVIPRGEGAETLESMYTKSRLKIATSNYEDLLDRLEAARLQLETARAGFKYRYSVITPPELPQGAVKPRIPMLIAGGVVLALALAFLMPILLEVANGRMEAEWQKRRYEWMPVIGNVRAP
jgi:uncharacterized protein involved in exopolysaccharide biosynthesis